MISYLAASVPQNSRRQCSYKLREGQYTLLQLLSGKPQTEHHKLAWCKLYMQWYVWARHC